MGLTVGIGCLLALGGTALAKIFFDEGQRLRRRFHRPWVAAFWYLLSLICAAAAVGGAALACAIIDAFLL